MGNREDWGLRLFFGGLVLGLVLMLFVTGSERSSFYANDIAPPFTEVMRPLGYVLDAGIVLAFALTVARMACFTFGPAPAGAPAPNLAVRDQRPPARVTNHYRHRTKPKQPPAPHGST